MLSRETVQKAGMTMFFVIKSRQFETFGLLVVAAWPEIDGKFESATLGIFKMHVRHLRLALVLPHALHLVPHLAKPIYQHRQSSQAQYNSTRAPP